MSTLDDAVNAAMLAMRQRERDVDRDDMTAAVKAAITSLGLTWAYDSLPVRRDTHVPAPRGAVRWAAKRLVGPWIPDEAGQS